MFRLLGLHPGPDITAAAAASIAARGLPRARRVLAELTHAHLLTDHGQDRYLCHDLIRTYAADQARGTDSHSERATATGRLLDYYLRSAHAAARLLGPSCDLIPLPRPNPEVAADLGCHQQAMDWFDAEQHVLHAVTTLATRAGAPHAWQLPLIMTGYLGLHGRWNETAAILHTALAAATDLSDAAGQAVTRRAMAFACARLSQYDQARAHLAACLELSRQLGDRSSQGWTYEILGYVADCQGRHAEALDHGEQALRLFQATGNTGGRAFSLNDIGWYRAQLGDYLRAQSSCQRVLILWRELGDRNGEALTHDTLGYVAHHQGRHADAARFYQQALSLSREQKNRVTEAEILSHLGDAYHAAGEPLRARDAWRQALAVREEIHHHAAERSGPGSLQRSAHWLADDAKMAGLGVSHR